MEEIKVWEGHHPAPEGAVLMGCAWLRDHFIAVISRLERAEDERSFLTSLVIAFAVLQLIFDAVIVTMLWRS